MVRPPTDEGTSFEREPSRRTVLRTLGLAAASLGAATTGAAAQRANRTGNESQPGGGPGTSRGRTTDASQFDTFLRIDGTDNPRKTSSYQFTVTGEVARDEERSTVGESATPWDVLEDRVDGQTVAGLVGNAVDVYGFSGEIERIEVQGEATHRVVRP